eukprot:CAMPEP_0203848848 /NCGR_PEP_ID=MMETSP0359-20131031/5836_1 /ASSEMBLY_ACC=CAM_ASM_000338 /TAXON_ID=268821 /ORGANISM="Scrippsiella Hangoei, Strain SHTV-5" /LENGTH=42 /DNA_ID= /DNA_START= /DNA_END= /DNA_ORIENTATION=
MGEGWDQIVLSVACACRRRLQEALLHVKDVDGGWWSKAPRGA